MTFKLTRMETAAGVVVFAQLALAAYTARFGIVGPVPMHFDMAGNVDRWGDRTQAAGVILIIAAITAACAGFMAFSLRRDGPDAARRRGLTLGMGITLAVTGGNWNGAGSVAGAVTSSSGTFTIGSGANLTATAGVSATGGAVVVNGTLTGTLNANSSTTISGTGTITGNATIQGIHNPGNSPGIQTFGANLAYTGGASVVNWELTNDTVTNMANPNAIFDQTIVLGNLDFTDLTTLNLIFNEAGSGVAWGDSLWTTDQSWTLYDVTGSTTNFGNLTLTTINWLDGSGNLFDTLHPNGGFSLSQSGNDVLLNYAAIPEPNVAALLGGFGVLALLGRRRK